MSEGLSVIPVFYLLGAAHGSFLVAALLSARGPRLANRYLAAFTWIFVLTLVDNFFDFTGLINHYTFVRPLLSPEEFLYGVLIYFYIRELTQPGEYPLRGWQWLHFAPALIHVLAMWLLFFMPHETLMVVLFDHEPASVVQKYWQLLLGDVEVAAALLHVCTYLLLSLQQLKSHRKRVLASYANMEKVSLNWLRNLIYGTLIVYLFWLLDEALGHFGYGRVWVSSLLGLSMVFLIYGMSILGLKQPEVFAASSQQRSTNGTASDEALLPIEDAKQIEDDLQDKYRCSSLTHEMSASLMSELKQYMTSNHAYRDNSLSLSKLAQELGISNNYLSQVINQQAEQNFFDFVNGYRITEVQNKLRNNDKETVLHMALAAGFNSKSAFYTAFKKHTGQTPTQFKQSLAKPAV